MYLSCVSNKTSEMNASSVFTCKYQCSCVESAFSVGTILLMMRNFLFIYHYKLSDFFVFKYVSFKK